MKPSYQAVSMRKTQIRFNSSSVNHNYSDLLKELEVKIASSGSSPENSMKRKRTSNGFVNNKKEVKSFEINNNKRIGYLNVSFDTTAGESTISKEPSRFNSGHNLLRNLKNDVYEREKYVITVNELYENTNSKNESKEAGFNIELKPFNVENIINLCKCNEYD